MKYAEELYIKNIKIHYGDLYMSADYSELEPTLVWKYFRELSNIPRCSKHEEKIREYIISVAKKLKMDYNRDEAGNVVIRKPATPGREKVKGVILQGHMDMVCEKNEDVKHDFSRDPIRFVIKDDYLYADGTTLGADNGIGLATGLALLEDSGAAHGPVEALFTTDEETGLTGAFHLEGDFVKGRRFLNLDSEEENVIYIGCAGGADTKITYTGKRISPSRPLKFVKITLKGLKGGHSGIDIDQGRGNAVQLLARALNKAQQKITLYIVDYAGGNKRNAIARECSAVVGMTQGNVTRFKRLIEKEMKNIKFENGVVEKDLTHVMEDVTGSYPTVFDRKSTRNIIGLLFSLPHGVMAMSMEIEKLVETSTNLAVARIDGHQLAVEMSSRSSITSAIQATKDKIRCVAENFGCKVEGPGGYPGWTPNLKSKLLKVVASTHKKLFDIEPEMKAIHAGLECGIIGEKFKKMDMVSIGPQIEHPHCPEERVKISSVGKFYTFVKGVLANLK